MKRPKKTRLLQHKERILQLYVEERIPVYRIREILLQEGHKFSVGLLSEMIAEAGCKRTRSEANVLRMFSKNVCENCENHFLPTAPQQRCCETCVPPNETARSRWGKFRVSQYDYERMLEEQDFRCALCPQHFNELSSKNIHIDHCHKTGKVRGVLCQRCNHCISRIEQNPGWGVRAEQYVESGFSKCST